MPTLRMQATAESLDNAVGKLTENISTRGRKLERYDGYTVAIYEGTEMLGVETSKASYDDALQLAREAAGIQAGTDMTQYQLRVTVHALAAGAGARGPTTTTYTDMF